jgi:conjugative transfer region protein (TIGR03750 family)
MREQEDRLADAVNQEPIVYMDCTQSELMGSIALGGLVGLSLGVVIGISIGLFLLGLIIGLSLSLLFSWACMTWLKSVRQKYYLTWFKEKIFLVKLSYGMTSSKYISHSERFGKGARRG